MTERKKKGAVEVRGVLPEKTDAIAVAPGVTIVITQAFCPNGHNLVRSGDAIFDGYPGIVVYVECEGWEGGEVMLSPIHGDHARIGIPRSVPDGTRCTIKCPECETPLPLLKRCGCEHGGELVALHLRPDLSQGDVVAVCNVVGCYRSRIVDKFELLSEFVQAEEG